MGDIHNKTLQVRAWLSAQDETKVKLSDIRKYIVRQWPELNDKTQIKILFDAVEV